jgi:hypothetical protein
VRRPQTLAQPMEDRQLPKRPAAPPIAFLRSPEVRRPQTLAQPMEDRQLLKRRDFCCDAGRHRKCDRNGDGRQS